VIASSVDAAGVFFNLLAAIVQSRPKEWAGGMGAMIMPFPAEAKRMKSCFRFPILVTAMLLVAPATFFSVHGSTGSSSNRVAAGPALVFNQRVIPVGGAPGSIVIADVNHDGKLDIIVANTADGTLSILLGDGKGHFTPAAGSPFACGKSPNDIATGDFNGDGNLDLLIADTGTPYLTMLLGDGKGGFAA
jgi:hypothetical protein